MISQERTILIIDDNPGDIRLTQEILKSSKFGSRLVPIYNGEEAIVYLTKALVNKTLPDLIILDLNLPRLNGIEVLEIIKTDLALKLLPVVILTSSEADYDIHKSYQNHANLYLTKPVDFDEYFKVVTNIEKFWFSIAKLPD